MKFQLRSWSLVVGYLVCTGCTHEAVRPVLSKISTQKLEELEGVAQYLTVVIQQDVDARLAVKTRARSRKKHDVAVRPRPILPCDPPAAEANQWLMRLKSRIDSELATIRAAYLSAPADQRGQDWVAQCASTCTCAVYADLIEQIPASQLGPQDEKIRTQLHSLAAATDDKNARACASALEKFCTGNLIKELKSEN